MWTKTMKKSFPYIIIGAVGLLLLLRCFYSFTWSDESFYLTIVHRFWLGERMIADEWFTIQLSSPLLLPFYSLYQTVTGGNEGIYLYYRILYWGLSTFITFFAYQKLKRQHPEGISLVCALMYYVYSRANIGGMSYYNMTLSMAFLAVILIYEQVAEKKYSCGKCYILGLLLAVAVVFTPYLAVPYLVIMGGLLVIKSSRVYARKLFAVLAGTATAAVMYLSYLFSRVTVEELLINIPYILNEPELQKTNPVLVLPIMAARIAWRYKWTILFWGMLLAYIFYSKLKKRALSEKEVRIIGGINLLLFLVNTYLSWGLIGCINIAAVLFATVYLLTGERKPGLNKKVLTVFGLAGASLSLAFSFSSDTGLDAMTIGFVILGMGAALLLSENAGLSKSVKAVLLIMLVQTAVLRIFSVYRDAPLWKLDTQITSGPAKYLYTTAEHVQQYEDLKQAIEKYVRPEDRVFYSQMCFWSYLCSNNEYGVPSSWRMPFNSKRLEMYYELNPDKIPTCIFVLNPTYGNFESSLIQGNEKAAEPNVNVIEGYLADYIKEKDYEVLEEECGIIFRLKKGL